MEKEQLSFKDHSDYVSNRMKLYTRASDIQLRMQSADALAGVQSGYMEIETMLAKRYGLCADTLYQYNNGEISFTELHDIVWDKKDVKGE